MGQGIWVQVRSGKESPRSKDSPNSLKPLSLYSTSRANSSPSPFLVSILYGLIPISLDLSISMPHAAPLQTLISPSLRIPQTLSISRPSPHLISLMLSVPLEGRRCWALN
eukprot:TRINITY_DN83824_c0_g1_i1.p1 TRINITY_DN83824_c0_g1~~TRINITY_DN83824_c0_g1_i1.p1  ORF type:complete len:110 (+),score=13.62 TRINITY_DN83824_c0_g1_i1:550-879(+)